MSRKINVLIVEDSAFYRQQISSMLKQSPNIEVIGMVNDGTEAITFISKTLPDVIALDLEMPRMDGFTFLRWLMANKPVPVLVISSLSESSNVFKALELGAADFLAKPTRRASMQILTLQDELLGKIETVASIPREKLRSRHQSAVAEPAPPAPAEVPPTVESSEETSRRIKLIAIGASTGGPPALQTIVSALPKDLPAAVAISQHMPPGFTKYFAERLNKMCGLEVREAVDGDLVENGWIYISPGGYHLVFERHRGGVQIFLQERTETDKYVPSVDVMMMSAAEVYRHQVLGIVLTGMGNDGRMGIRKIKDCGGFTIAESEETAVVFGMPKEAILEGAVDKILPLHEIAADVVRRCLNA